MNNKLRNALIALAILIGIGFLGWIAYGIFTFWDIWHEGFIKL